MNIHRSVKVVFSSIGDDEINEAYVTASLVEQVRWTRSTWCARSGGPRSVRCYQRRGEAGGLAVLGRPGGYPAGCGTPIARRGSFVGRLRAEVRTSWHIAERVDVPENAICEQVQQLAGRRPSRRS